MEADFNEYKLPPIPKPKRKYKVYNLQAHEEDPFAVTTAEETEKFGTEHGIEVTTLDAGGFENVEKQIAQIQTAVTQGADAIWISATDANAVVPALEEAEEQGVKVINFWQPTPKPFSGLVSGDFEDDGFQMSKALFETMGEEGTVYSILGGAGSTYEEELKAGLQKALKAYPNMKLAGEQVIPDFDPGKTQTITENALTANPEIGGIYTATTGMAVGVYTGSAAVGDEISTVGEIIQECAQLQMLEEGKLPIILGVPAVFYSRMIVAITIPMLNGEKYKKVNVIPGNIYTAQNINEAPLELEIAHHFIAECQEEIENG